MKRERYDFGPFSMDIGRRVLLRKGVMLQPGQRALVLLETLLAAEGRPVTKAELMDAAWHGVAVEESNLSVQIAALRKILGRKPDGSEWINTVQRLGYQMVLTPAQPHGLPEAREDGSAPGSGRPSIAVLPFDNLSIDPAEAFFSDGLTDEIITGLSRLRDVFVIARNTVFSYKGKPMDVRSLGAELGVEYILEGSVRSAGGCIRVMAQLVDARTGKHVWIDRFDGVAGDVFAIQDEITQKVVRKIGPEMLAAEHVRAMRKPTRSLNAWECYVRALFLSARLSQEDSRAALILLNQAVEHDPHYAQAMGLIAWLAQFRAAQGWDEREQAIAIGEAMSERAIAADEGEPWGWAGRGCIGFTLRQPSIAIPALEHAVEIAPSFAFGHGLLSLAFSFAGYGGEARARLDAAVRLSPQELFQGSFAQQYAFAYFQESDYASALRNAERSHQLRSGHLYPLVVAAASAAYLGNGDAAGTFLGKLKAVAPYATVGWFENAAPYVLLEDRSRLSEGVRLAGLA